MEIKIAQDQQNQQIQVVQLAGEIDASTAPKVQAQVLPLVEPGSKILLDVSQISFMSSAGLRFLLSLYRQAAAQDSQLVLVGLSPELQDTMSITGFLSFFTTYPTLEAGLTALR